MEFKELPNELTIDELKEYLLKAYSVYIVTNEDNKRCSYKFEKNIFKFNNRNVSDTTNDSEALEKVISIILNVLLNKEVKSANIIVDTMYKPYRYEQNDLKDWFIIVEEKNK